MNKKPTKCSVTPAACRIVVLREQGSESAPPLSKTVNLSASFDSNPVTPPTRDRRVEIPPIPIRSVLREGPGSSLQKLSKLPEPQKKPEMNETNSKGGLFIGPANQTRRVRKSVAAIESAQARVGEQLMRASSEPKFNPTTPRQKTLVAPSSPVKKLSFGTSTLKPYKPVRPPPPIPSQEPGRKVLALTKQAPPPPKVPATPKQGPATPRQSSIPSHPTPQNPSSLLPIAKSIPPMTAKPSPSAPPLPHRVPIAPKPPVLARKQYMKQVPTTVMTPKQVPATPKQIPIPPKQVLLPLKPAGPPPPPTRPAPTRATMKVAKLGAKIEKASFDVEGASTPKLGTKVERAILDLERGASTLKLGTQIERTPERHDPTKLSGKPRSGKQPYILARSEAAFSKGAATPSARTLAASFGQELASSSFPPMPLERMGSVSALVEAIDRVCSKPSTVSVPCRSPLLPVLVCLVPPLTARSLFCRNQNAVKIGLP